MVLAAMRQHRPLDARVPRAPHHESYYLASKRDLILSRRRRASRRMGCGRAIRNACLHMRLPYMLMGLVPSVPGLDDRI
jgi:hypothetical protein